MKRFKIAGIIVLIMIFVGAVVLSVKSSLFYREEMSKARSEGTLNSWATFQNDPFDFTFKYPSEAVVDITDPAVEGKPKRVRVRLIGPQSEPNTEITDGFTFYVRSDSLNEQETLAKAANRIFKAETENSEVIDELTSSEINDQDAYSFSVRSELGGEVTYTLFEGRDEAIFITTSVLSIPNGSDRDYWETIERMQESLQKKVRSHLQKQETHPDF